MFITSYASVFILKDSVWVAMNETLSWAYIRLKTVTNSEGVASLILSISSQKSFNPNEIVLETQVISSSKWILVADDFAEFEVDQQRYGAYFENEKTATMFTGAIAEGLHEVRTGVITSKAAKGSANGSGLSAKASSESRDEVGHGQGPKPKKATRRKSLAQFEEVNDAVNSCGVTVTESIDLGAPRNSDTDKDGSETETGSVNTSKSDDFDFNLAIEKQITTVYNRESVEEAFKRFDMNTTPSSNQLSPRTRYTIGISAPTSDGSDSPEIVHRKTTVTTQSTSQPKKNKVTLSSFASIFRKSTQKSASPNIEAEYERSKDSPPLPDRKMLGCLPNLSRDFDDDDMSNSIISAPDSVLHMTSVHFNEVLGRYEGLPEEWKVQNRVFGVPLTSLPKRDDPNDQYDEPIPTVLLLMKEHLIRLDAKAIVGIFRLAPDKDDCNIVKDLINKGEYDYNTCQDPNILANLLKVFFRELPQNLFNSIPEREILKIASLKTIEEVVEEMSTGILSKSSSSLILWLLDFMSIFVRNEHVNKMSAKNMAIVVSPNLYGVNSENPMVALTMAQKVAEFTTKILAGRLKMKYDYDAGIK